MFFIVVRVKCSKINSVHFDDIFIFQFVYFDGVTPLCYNILACKWFDKFKSFCFLGNLIASYVFNKMCQIVNYKN